MRRFDIASELLSLSNAAPTEPLTKKTLSRLDNLEDLIVENPRNILATDDTLGAVKCLVRNFTELSDADKHRLCNFLLAGLAHLFKEVAGSPAPQSERPVFDCYVFLLYHLALSSEPPADGPKSAPLSAKPTASWSPARFRERLVELLNNMFVLPVARIWTTTHDRDNVFSVLLKAVHIIFESPESMRGATNLKSCLFRLAALVYKHGSPIIQSTLRAYVAQSLRLHEHVAEPFAMLLTTMVSDEFQAHQLVEDVLLDMAASDDLDSAAVAKSYSVFLIALSESVPRCVLKNITHIIDFLSHEPYSLRVALLEVIRNLIVECLLRDTSEYSEIQSKSFFRLIEERFRDVNAFVRAKVLSVCTSLCQAKAIPISRFQSLVALTIDRLSDRNSNVRKRAIQLLGEFLKSHPFVFDGGELSLSSFEQKMQELDALLQQMAPPEVLEALASSSSSFDFDAAKAMSDALEEPTPLQRVEGGSELAKLVAVRRSLYGGIRFIHQLSSAMPTLCQLLASQSRLEAIESIEFIALANLYKIEAAKEGLRKMIHLVWTKDTSATAEEMGSEDAKTRSSVRDSVLHAYRTIYLDVDASFSAAEKYNQMAYSLVTLVNDLTFAELISFEEMMVHFVSRALLPAEVVRILWAHFENKRESLEIQRACIILLSMVSEAAIGPAATEAHLDWLMKYGISHVGLKDPAIAKYLLLTLQRLAGPKSGSKKGNFCRLIYVPMVHASYARRFFCRILDGQDAITLHRLESSHPVFGQIGGLVLRGCTSESWMMVLEQAVQTIYLLAAHPDAICGSLIKQMAAEALTTRHDAPSSAGLLMAAHSFSLAKLLSLAGHVAIQQVSHLDRIESEMKRRVNQQAGASNAATAGQPGSTDDHISDTISRIKEKELLFGQRSLLACFGTLVAHICERPSQFACSLLQRIAALALAKFMCLSSRYCELHLPLFLHLLDASPSGVVRGNLVIAFGDLVMTQSNMLDPHLGHLFRRVRDPDLHVKKNALMVLMHLILNGMVKVKGQISEMAKCLEDSDPRISDLAKLFFTELAEKDNSIYNNLPDMISNLSTMDMEEGAFERIMTFILGFVKKEKQAENVIEKLCQRFRVAAELRQWSDIALCLSLLPYQSERCVRALIDNMPFYWDKLYEPAVFGYFCEIIGKAKKFQKSESKLLLEDFEKKVMELNEKNADLNLLQSIQLNKEKKTAVATRVKKTTKALRDMKLVDSGDANEVVPSDSEDDLLRKKKAPAPRSIAKKKPAIESGDEAIGLGEDAALASAPVSQVSRRPRPVRKAALAGQSRRAIASDHDAHLDDDDRDGAKEDIF